MAKKDKKSKTAEQKARVAAKQSKKSAQKEKKSKSRANEDSDMDDVDLESVLEEYARQVFGPLSIICSLEILRSWIFHNFLQLKYKLLHEAYRIQVFPQRLQLYKFDVNDIG